MFLCKVSVMKTPTNVQVNRIIRALFSTKNSVISKEVTKFERLKNTFWQEDGPLNGLHKLNNIRVSFIRDELSSVRDKSKVVYTKAALPLQDLAIADIGCGAGILSEAMAKLGANVTGIDASSELITVARQHKLLTPFPPSNLNYVDETLDTHIKTHSCHYDAVICSEVIEHVENKKVFIEQVVKLVKSGGSLIFTTQNKTWLVWFAVVFWTENVTKLIPKGTHHYNMFISPDDLLKLLKRNGCYLKKLQGVCATPSLKFFYANTLQFSYFMHARKE